MLIHRRVRSIFPAYRSGHYFSVFDVSAVADCASEVTRYLPSIHQLCSKSIPSIAKKLFCHKSDLIEHMPLLSLYIQLAWVKRMKRPLACSIHLPSLLNCHRLQIGTLFDFFLDFIDDWRQVRDVLIALVLVSHFELTNILLPLLYVPPLVTIDEQENTSLSLELVKLVVLYMVVLGKLFLI